MSEHIIQCWFPNKNGKYTFRLFSKNPPYQSVIFPIQQKYKSHLIYQKDDWYVNDPSFYQNLIRNKFPIWTHKSLYKIVEYIPE